MGIVSGNLPTVDNVIEIWPSGVGFCFTSVKSKYTVGNYFKGFSFNISDRILCKCIWSLYTDMYMYCVCIFVKFTDNTVL